MFENEESRNAYKACMQNVRGPEDIPNMIQTMLQQNGDNLDPEMRKKVAQMKGMSQAQMLAFCRKEMKSMNKKSK